MKNALKMPIMHSAGTFDKTPKQKRDATAANKKRDAEEKKFWKEQLPKLVLTAVGKSKNAQ
jgi:hypothetical protein